jgi:hypothetical protein
VCHFKHSPEIVALFTSQWRVWPADSLVPTGPASTIAKVYFAEDESGEVPDVTVKVGAEETSDDGKRMNRKRYKR